MIIFFIKIKWNEVRKFFLLIIFIEGMITNGI